VTDNAKIEGKIELVYEATLPESGLKETELQKEQMKKYR
jgi:hypothetical protein